MRAPNGQPTKLTERQWVQVRTPAFKEWFGDWEANAEIDAQKRRIIEWASDANAISWAKGKALKDCEAKFGGELETIAYIPEPFVSHFDGRASDNRVYTSKGYFIDHIANHGHDDIGATEYSALQEMFNEPDEVIKDTRLKPNGEKRNSLLFVKRFAKNRLAAVELSAEEGHIVLHKSLYNTKDRVYPGLPRVDLSGGGRSPISRAADATPGGSLSARDGNIKSNFLRPVKGASRVVDENGEPMVMWHGSTWNPANEPNGAAVFRTGEGETGSGAHFGTRTAAEESDADDTELLAFADARAEAR
ncbi:MAG: hypothetical protein K6G91_13105 [Kiritimatiellae bacterium]|nr:hypothetical protein [Kiritimatiellia bacterium]